MDRLAAERELVSVSVPGFGGSPLLPPGREPGAPEFARAIADFVREEVGDEPLEIAGHSLGGWTALELAKLGVASRVTAIAPAGFWTPREAVWSRLYLGLTAGLSRHAGGVLDAAFGSAAGRRLFLTGQWGHPERLAPEVVRGMKDTLCEAPGFDDTLATMSADRFRNDPPIAVPVTIVWGTRDVLLLPRQAPRAARETGGELVWIEGGGHFAHWDDQETAIRVLLR
jgi:pimeloyl-ACP methyl ester carboxylesterase